MTAYTGPLTDLYELDAKRILGDYVCGHCHGPLETKPAESGNKGPIGHPLLSVYCPRCGEGYTPESKEAVNLAAKEERIFQMDLKVASGTLRTSLSDMTLEERIKKLYPD